MLSKPDDWKFNYTNFKRSLGIGEKAIRSILKKLEELKYLKRERIRDENGQYEWNFFVYEEPYDLLLKKENLPYVASGYMASGNAVNGNIYQNTDITKDNIDSIDKTKILHHKALINELIREGYISEDDDQIILYDSLFNKFINNGYSYKDLYSSIHYIVTKVISRNFIDEEGTVIINKGDVVAKETLEKAKKYLTTTKKTNSSSNTTTSSTTTSSATDTSSKNETSSTTTTSNEGKVNANGTYTIFGLTFESKADYEQWVLQGYEGYAEADGIMMPEEEILKQIQKTKRIYNFFKICVIL